MPEQLDHINRNSVDNRIENLRIASKSENMMNRKTFKNSTSGCRGVSWNKHLEKWVVYVDVNKKRKHLGYFDTAEEAHKVFMEAKRLHHEYCTV